jgi:hypothetical protein
MNGTRRVHLPWLIASRGLFLSLTFLAAPAVFAQDAPAPTPTPTPEPETPKIDVTGFDSDGGFVTIGQKAQTVTLTSAHVVARALSARLEYRGDFTQEPCFTFGGRI